MVAPAAPVPPRPRTPRAPNERARGRPTGQARDTLGRAHPRRPPSPARKPSTYQGVPARDRHRQPAERHGRDRRRVLGGGAAAQPDVGDGLRRRALQPPAARPVGGRARGRDRGGPPRVRRGGRAPGRDLSNEDRITRDMLQRARGARGARTRRSHAYEVREVDQIYGPQTRAAPGRDVPARRHARAPRARGSTGCRAYGPYIDAHIEILHEGLGRRAGRRARIVAERTIDQLRRLVDTPLDQAVIPSLARRSRRTRTASASARSSGRRATRRNRRYLEALLGRVPRGDARGARDSSSAPDGEAPLPPLHPPLDDARPGARGRPPGRPRRARHDRRGAAGDRAAARASATTSTRYRPLAHRRPGEPRPRSVEELVARATEDIERAGAIAPQVFGTAAAGWRASSSPSSRSRRRTRRSRTTTRRRSTARGPASTTSTPTTCRAGRTTSSRRRRTTRRSRVTTSRSRSRWSTRRSTCSAGWARALVAGAFVEGWGLYAERLADELGLYRDDGERLGMLDAQAWRAARLIVDSGMHGLGWSRQQSIDWLLKTGLSDDRRRDRDRPLHRVAGPGPHLHDRDARDPPAAPGARGARRRPVRHHARSTTQLIGHGSLPLATLARSCRAGSPRA